MKHFSHTVRMCDTWRTTLFETWCKPKQMQDKCRQLAVAVVVVLTAVIAIALTITTKIILVHHANANATAIV